MVVTEARFKAAGAAERETGLLGYASFVLGGCLAVDGVAVRRTRDGRLALSYPEKRDRNGRGYPYMRPLSREAARVIEEQVLFEIGEEVRHAASR